MSHSAMRYPASPWPLAGLGASLFSAVLAMGCAGAIPKGRYGVSSVQVKGMQQVEEGALLACLATRARPRWGFAFGSNPEPQCEVPPFDAGRIPVEFWAWPWTEWPLYDEAVLERDVDRIERWYRARGFYQAEVRDVELVKDREEREIDVEFMVFEGEPVLVERLEVAGLEPLPKDVREAAREAVLLKAGERFDEALYDQSKDALAHVLSEASHAKAAVHGRVLVEPKSRRAKVWLIVVPGPRCRFGSVRVEGNRHLTAVPILGAANIRRGMSYSESKLKDAQDAIYALGAFASVEVIPEPKAEADSVDVLIRVVPARPFRFAVGAGMEAGKPGIRGEGPEQIGQDASRWDLHLLLRAEHRNFLGGMRRFQVEDRPRLVFPNEFPQTENKGEKAKPGNLVMVELDQPAFLEPRTTLTTAAEWDYGLDPYEQGVSRHDLDTWIGPGRYFFRHKLFASSTIHFNLFLRQEGGPMDYHVTFFRHALRLDLRDNPRRPREGSFFALTFEHAGYFLPSAWDYLRFKPEARGYFSLPLGLVLAGRLRLGLLHIDRYLDVEGVNNCGELEGSDDAKVRALCERGPIRYRLRAGGPNSVRGYRPNAMGDVDVDEQGHLITGGLRQWEATLELRAPITVDFGTVVFVDVGDVTVQEVFYFDKPKTAVGFGLRYHTVVGPLRLDVGFLPKALQAYRPSEPRPSAGGVFGLAHGAVHFTIGEAF